MRVLLAYLAVFVGAAIPWLEVLLVVPAGILAGLPALPVAVVAAAGNILTLIPVIVAGDRLRAWWRRRRRRIAQLPDPDEPATEVGPSLRAGRAQRLFDRYGLPGLALLGPVLTGIHVAAVAAVAAGAQRRPALWWLSGGVVLWALVAALLTVLGIEALFDPDDLPRLPGL